MPSFRIEEHDSTLWLENRGEAHDNKGLGGGGGGGVRGGVRGLDASLTLLGDLCRVDIQSMRAA